MPESNLAEDFAQTRGQVAAIVGAMAPGHDMAGLDRMFGLVASAYDGRLPGYQRLRTPYHNHAHTLEVVLCAARLLHGLSLAGRPVGAAAIDMGLIGALLHDIGYLMRAEEGGGSGAQFTLEHVMRGAQFAREHLDGMPPSFVGGVVNVILVTDHRLPLERIVFADAEARLAALATGTADLVSQMANRDYLERLLLLYFEFKEAGLGGFEDFEALLEKTAAFYRMTKERLDGPLENLSPYLAKHFEHAEGVSCNRYQETIDKNLAYLERVLQSEEGRRVEMLKRSGIVARALEKYGT